MQNQYLPLIEIECDGEDENEALAEIVKDFKNNFGE